MKVIKSNIK